MAIDPNKLRQTSQAVRDSWDAAATERRDKLMPKLPAALASLLTELESLPEIWAQRGRHEAELLVFQASENVGARFVQLSKPPSGSIPTTWSRASDALHEFGNTYDEVITCGDLAKHAAEHFQKMGFRVHYEGGDERYLKVLRIAWAA